MEDPESVPLNHQVIEMQQVELSDDLKNRLRQAVRKDDLETYSKIMANIDFDTLDKVHENDMTLFEIMCTEITQNEYMMLIFSHISSDQKKAILNRINEKYNMAPLHFALRSKRYEVFQRMCQEADYDYEIVVNAFRMIIKDVIDELDRNDQSVKQRFGWLINCLIDGGKYVIKSEDLSQLIDLANDNDLKFVSEKLAENVMVLHALSMCIDNLLVKLPTDTANVVRLFEYVENEKYENFELTLKRIKNNHEINKRFYTRSGYNTILNLACRKGLGLYVKALLSKTEVDRNKEFPVPICIACENGYYEILEMLLKDPQVSVDPKTTSNRSLFEYAVAKTEIESMDNHEKCLLLLFADDRIAPTLNYQSPVGSTALHRAVNNGYENLTHLLLRNGATINTFNDRSKCPLHGMPTEAFEKHLDECLTSDVKNKEIHFIYDFLKPRKDCKYRSAPEMNVLLQMTRIPRLRHLIKHPVISSFVYLKWNRIKYLYYLNICLFLNFYGSLIALAIADLPTGDKTYEVSVVVFLTVFAVMMASRETVQYWKYPRRYVINWENWLEIIMILLSLVIVVHKILIMSDVLEDDIYVSKIRRQICVTAVLLATIEYVLLLGRLSVFSTYFMMLYTVSRNVFIFFFLFSSLFVGFATIFHVLFHPVEQTETNMFSTAWSSIFKTFIMFTGEYEIGSINFSTYPVMSQFMFTMFVFIITIVLFNLLNGLAISDIQAIKADAELLVVEKRIEMLSLCECIFFGVKQKVVDDDFDEYDYFYKIEEFARNPEVRTFIAKPPDFSWLAKQICLFPHEFRDFKEKIVKVSTKPIYQTTLKNGKLPPHVVKLDQNIVKVAQMKINEKFEKDRDLRLKTDDECKRHRLEVTCESTLESLKRIEENAYTQQKHFSELYESQKIEIDYFKRNFTQLFKEFLNKHEKSKIEFQTTVETKISHIETKIGEIENNVSNLRGNIKKQIDRNTELNPIN